ncbi:MAG: nucleotidyltransferase domain-containing protein [bacterium]
MSKVEAKKIVRRYAKKLEKNNYPFSAIYLFGSYAQNKNNKWSDIDVAVVSDKLRKNNDKNRFLLWDMRLDIDTRIEPHGFTVQDFQNECNPMASEIRKTGVRIL